MKKLDFKKIKSWKRSKNSEVNMKSKLSEIINKKDDCILCNKDITFRQMPNLIKIALAKKNNDYKNKEYLRIIDNILFDKYSRSFGDFIEINSNLNNENIFRKFYHIFKFKAKMNYLFKIYQFVIFNPKNFQRNIFKIINKYFSSVKKVRDKFLHDLIEKMDEEEILKLKIDIRNIFDLKQKDIIFEKNTKNIKNKFLDLTSLNFQNIQKNIKFSIQNIINNFKGKKLKNNQNDLNISSGLLKELKNNFKNSLSEILNCTIFKHKNINDDYSQLTFINHDNLNKNERKKDTKTKRNFKKKNKEKIIKLVDNKKKVKNYSIKKVKIINNININNNKNKYKYNEIIKNLNFPLNDINFKKEINNIIKTTTNRKIKTNEFKTYRECYNKSKGKFSNRKSDNFNMFKNNSNSNNKNKILNFNNKILKEKIQNIKNALYKNKIKSSGKKYWRIKNSNELVKDKYFKKKFQTVKYKSLKNKFVNSPAKWSNVELSKRFKSYK